MTIKERLQEFIDKINTNQYQFEISAGLSNGFVNKIGDTIRKKNLDKISKAFPELNVFWLETGTGSMLKSKYEVDEKVHILKEDGEQYGHSTNEKNALLELIAANKKLADAHYEMALAHKVLAQANHTHADNNSILINRLQGSSIADDQEETVASQLEKFRALLEVVAEVGAGSSPWKTKEEGLVILSKRVYGNLQKKNQKDSSGITGKPDKAVKIS